MNKHFLSCDWGTSNFRLRLVALNDLQVAAEVSADKGVAGLAKAWGEKGSGNEDARVRFYTGVLKEQLSALQQKTELSLDGLRIVISGMASSTIGLANLPYQQLPVPVDGTVLKTKSFPPTPDTGHELLLISGVRSDDDVMRGEETQLIGCLTPEMQQYSGEQLIVHPGTHSKHITITGGQVTNFKTYMTGESFKLFTTHGILRDNVAANDLSDGSMLHFEQGVRDSVTKPLLHAMFKVRTNDLFGRMSREDNYHYLSGLLIGSELDNLKSVAAKMYLCCGPAMHRQYCAALDVLGLDSQVHVFPAEWEEGSVVRGQAKVLAHFMS